MADIKISFGGIMVLLFNNNSSGQPVECLAGIVKDVPDHELTIKGRKIDATGTATDFEIDPLLPELFFEVEGTSETGIRLFNLESIDRIAGLGDPQSFSWVLDFESDGLYDPSHECRPQQVPQPTPLQLWLRSFTDTVSENHLLHQPESDPTSTLLHCWAESQRWLVFVRTWTNPKAWLASVTEPIFWLKSGMAKNWT